MLARLAGVDVGRAARVFFFVAGLLTERAVARRGPRLYARDRVLRLGLPWLASALLVWPPSVWLAYSAADRQVPADL